MSCRDVCHDLISFPVSPNPFTFGTLILRRGWTVLSIACRGAQAHLVSDTQILLCQNLAQGLGNTPEQMLRMKLVLEAADSLVSRFGKDAKSERGQGSKGVLLHYEI